MQPLPPYVGVAHPTHGDVGYVNVALLPYVDGAAPILRNRSPPTHKDAPRVARTLPTPRGRRPLQVPQGGMLAAHTRALFKSVGSSLAPRLRRFRGLRALQRVWVGEKEAAPVRAPRSPRLISASD